MSRYSILLAACAAVLYTAPVVAQDAGSQAATSVATTLPSTESSSPAAGTDAGRVVGPTVASGIVGVRATSERPMSHPPVAVERVGRNPAMMIIGAAAIVVGGFIGDDAGTIIMVSGAVVGLVGLWRFLQ